jgi:hypothetical protein
MTLVPIRMRDASVLAASLLAEALGHGEAQVTEIGEGQVKTVRVEHRGQAPLLLLDGEEVIGAKQNRVFNASFLIAPGATVDVPVSCVEKGRWRQTGAQFASSGHTMVMEARAEKMKRVSSSVTRTGRYDADQGAVWKDVDGYLARTQTSSATGAHAEAAAKRRAAIDPLIAVLAPAPDQLGVAAVRGGKLLSLELMGTPGLFARAWPTVARGLLGESGVAEDGDPEAVVARCIAALAAAAPTRTPAPGLGDSLHVLDADYAAGALAHRGHVYHLLATTA